jgi:succinyl-CoA synthetase beta subunit
MKCDIIANGIIAALKQISVPQPIVVRLAGECAIVISHPARN